jgi:hypothetical protein
LFIIAEEDEISPEDKERFEKFKGSLDIAGHSPEPDLSSMDEIDTHDKKS